MLTAALFLTSCGRYASEKTLDGISLLMSKEEVLEKMRSTGVARGAIVNKHGQTIEVREYKMKNWAAVSWDDFSTTYWLYFCDGTLVQWGRAGDWAEAQKMIYDVNFNIPS